MEAFLTGWDPTAFTDPQDFYVVQHQTGHEANAAWFSFLKEQKSWKAAQSSCNAYLKSKVLEEMATLEVLEGRRDQAEMREQCCAEYRSRVVDGVT